MHIDLDKTPSGTFHSEICIIGGGIAGLILATRLAAHGIAVHLLEAGGLEQEARSQNIFNDVDQIAQVHRGESEGRFRTFGGSSTRWGGQLLPFTRDVFQPELESQRPWPITEEDLAPYYPEIEAIFKVDSLPFDQELLPELGKTPISFSQQIRLRFSKWASFATRSLAQTLGPAALQHPEITVFSHANVTRLDGEGDRITAARACNYADVEFRFTADQFVVAAGTVESSRLLLASAAVPNPHDQLGRYFHDHLSFKAARFASPIREQLLERLGPFFVNGTLHTCKLEASESTRIRENMLAVMAHIVITEPADSGTSAFRNMLRSVQHGRLKHAVAVNFLPLLKGTGDVFRLLYMARFKRRRAVSQRAEVTLAMDVEQAPDPDNRIRLGARHDAFGMPIAVMDWRVNSREQQTTLRFAELIKRELEALNLAPDSWASCIRNQTTPEMIDTYHAMGGLCMGDDPTSSVVDHNLKLHQLHNLYVASCAVFPSGSSSNPTFTMMALTMRLADNLIRGRR